MKIIFNKVMVSVTIILLFLGLYIIADYQQYIKSNIKNTVNNIELKFDEVKVSADELFYLKDKTCQEMMLPLQKIVVLSPTIDSISVIRNGKYYCSSIVGINISKKESPIKEINIKENDLLTGLPAISYYHRYDNLNGIQFHMTRPLSVLEESRVGSISLSNQQSIISTGNKFGEHTVNDKEVYHSGKYDFLILLKYDRLASVKHYVIDNRLAIVISLLVIALLKVLSIKSVLFNTDYFKLIKAIKYNEIKPFVQPIVNEEEEVVGGEVLARWITEKEGIISPIVFIPKVEKFGLMNSMTKSLLGQLVDSYQSSPQSELRISVNLTENCLYDDEIFLLCKQLSDKCLLVLEFTESTEFEDRYKIITYMQKFRDIGVKFALDDYGTGYSSLRYLNYYQFDYIKIDKSFIDDIETNVQSLKILENIISLANNLDIKLVVEGIENKNQQQILHELQVSLYQGFLFFKPMPLNDFNVVVNAN